MEVLEDFRVGRTLEQKRRKNHKSIGIKAIVPGLFQCLRIQFHSAKPQLQPPNSPCNLSTVRSAQAPSIAKALNNQAADGGCVKWPRGCYAPGCISEPAPATSEKFNAGCRTNKCFQRVLRNVGEEEEDEKAVAEEAEEEEEEEEGRTAAFIKCHSCND